MTNLDLFGGPPRAPSTDAAAPGVDPQDDRSDQGVAPGEAEPESQMDLFRDAPAEVAAHAAQRAVRALAVDEARRHLAMLRSLPAFARFVADGDACLELIERRDVRWRDVARAVPWIESTLWPATERFVPGEAMRLLRPALLALLHEPPPAQEATDARRAHPAHLWHLLGEPERAAAAIASDPRGLARADALMWHADLCEQAGLHALALADVVELCLSWPAQAEQWLGASPAWAARWATWCELDDALPMHAFPAWARLHCTHDLPLPDAGDDRSGADLLRAADRLARDPNDPDRRRALQQLSPVLLGVYLEGRAARSR